MTGTWGRIRDRTVAGLSDLSFEMLTSGRPSLKEAVGKDMRRCVLDHNVPDLAGFIQRALNTDAREQQHAIEVMLNMAVSRLSSTPRLCPHDTTDPEVKRTPV